MNTVKDEIRAILDKLPDDCELEDIQCHLYVAEKIHSGIDRAEKEGTISQDEAEKRFKEWISKC